MKKLIRKLLCVFLVLVFSLSIALTVTVNAATGEDIVKDLIENYVGQYPYVLNTHGPKTFDCTGIVYYVYKQYGITLPYTTRENWTSYGEVITDVSKLQSGDVLLFGTNAGLNHAGIYDANGGYIIHALNSNYGIIRKPTLTEWISSPSWNSQGSNQFQYAIRIFGKSNSTPSTPTTPPSGGKPSGISDTSRTLRWKELWQIYNDSTVTELQNCLNYIMSAGLNVDGCYGIETHDAVKEFQGTYGLKVDGDAGPQTLTKVNEVLNGISEPVHTHNYTGSYYDESHPHKEYKKCDCSQIEYTGKTKQMDNCEECHIHDYTVHYDKKHPHTQYKECDCGDIVYTDKTKQMVDCEECHVHDYTVRYNKKHPHTQYKECDCGDIIIDENETKKVKSCEICYPVKKERIVKLHIGLPQMTVDGKVQKIDPGKNTSPLIMNGRTLLPIRAVVESFGADVWWNETEEKVSIYTDDVTMHLWINSKKASVNGKTYTMDVAPIIENERTFMPLRFIAENLGLDIDWDDSAQMITVRGEPVV